MAEDSNDIEVLRIKERVSDQSMNEAIQDYDRAIKRLEILLGINGVILTISVQSLTSFNECSTHTFLSLFAILMGISTAICAIGMFIPRKTDAYINPRSYDFDGKQDLADLLIYLKDEKMSILTSHAEMTEDVWRYTKSSMAVLLMAIFVLLMAVFTVIH